MNRSGVITRTGAALLDGLIYILLSVVTYVACFQYDLFNQNDLWNIRNSQLAPSLLQKLFLIQTSLYLIYFLTEIFFAASLGKICLGLSISKTNKDRANGFQLLIRFLFKHVAVLLYSAGQVMSRVDLKMLGIICLGVTGVGCILILGPARMALYDYIARTVIYPTSLINAHRIAKSSQSKIDTGFRRRSDLDKW